MKVAITGTIGAGKSTVSKYLRDRGYQVIDTDALAHSYYAKGSAVYAAIIQNFGPDILDENGDIDRKKLGARVFQNKSELAMLEQLVHPQIQKDIQALNHDKNIVFVEVPLLFEKNMEHLFQKVVMVDAPKNIRIERLKTRGLSEEDALARMAIQMDGNEKRSRSHFIIENGEDIESLHKSINILINKLEGDYE